MDGRSLQTGNIKVHSHEADRDVQDLAGHLMPVNEGAPLLVNGDET